MTNSQLRFPDYGDDGDIAGAHRARWAFRLSVLSLILLTGFAWISENYGNYGAAERNFRSAITQKRDAARVFLQSAIRLDPNAKTDAPTPKYTQALAVREEDDAALDTYAHGFEMDPNSSFFAIRYGCRLFVLGRPDEAAEKFRHARSLPPANALPRYLEAAAAARADRSPKGLNEAIVLLSRANNTRDPLVFPKPIWFSGFPQTGTQYSFLSREIYAESCAPLYTLVQQLLRVVESGGVPEGQNAKTWLNQIVTMGERLVSDTEPEGTLQAIAGVTFQLQALGLLEKMQPDAEGENAEALKPIIEKRVKLEQSLEMLNGFESQREAQVTAIEAEFKRPLLLTVCTAALFVLAYMLARTMHAVLRYRKTAWALQHSLLGKAVLGIGVGTYLVLLALMAILQRMPLDQQWYLSAVSTAWWGVTAVLVGFGVIYPGLRLAAPEDVSKKSGRLEDMPEVVRMARQAYRRVYAAFVVRYYGILCGIYFCGLCLWILSYRVVNGLYPIQINLLANGLIRQEQDVVISVIKLLS